MDFSNDQSLNVSYDDWLANSLEETYKSLRASQETTNIILTVFLAIVFLVGSTGNILVLIVFARNKTKQTATVFIMALATTDLTICLVVLPGVLIKEWYVPFRWDTLCRGWELVRCATIPLSTLILAVVAVDRYILICRVGRCRSISTQQAKWILVGIILCSLGLGVPPMLRVGVYQQGSSPGKSTEYLGLCISNDFLIDKASLDHYWQAMAAKFFLLLVSVVVLYSMIFQAVYRQGMWPPGGPKKNSAKGADGNSNRAKVITTEALQPGLQNVPADITLQHEQTNSSCATGEHVAGGSYFASQYAENRFYLASSKLTRTCNVEINVSEVKNSVRGVDTSLQLAKNHGISSANSSSQSLADVEGIDARQNTAVHCPVTNNNNTYLVVSNQNRNGMVTSCRQTTTDDLQESQLYDKLNQADLYEHVQTQTHTDNNLEGPQTSHNNELSLKTKEESNQDNNNFTILNKSEHRARKHDRLTSFQARLTRLSGHSNFFNLKFLCRNQVHPVHKKDGVTTPALGSDSNHTKSLNPQPCLQYHISDARQRRIWSAQVKTAKVLLLVTVVYVLSFAPVLLMTLDAIPSHPIPFYGYFLHSAANPVIYSFINQNFRRQLMQLFKCRQFTE